jgi:hypothetical protein
MQTISRYASLPQFAAPVWQKILSDPIQIALENHTMTWGSLALDDEPLKKWMTQPVVQTYEEPTTRRVRFADEVTDTPVVGTSLMHLITPMQKQNQQVLQPQTRSLMHLITPIQCEPYPNPSNICTVVIYNLPRSTTNVVLYDNLCQYGTIEQITIPKNNDPSKGPVGSIKGFAMVRFSNPRESAVAVAMEKSCRTQIEFAKSDRK